MLMQTILGTHGRNTFLADTAPVGPGQCVLERSSCSFLTTQQQALAELKTSLAKKKALMVLVFLPALQS